MVSVKLSSSKPPAFARGFPLKFECAPESTVGDIKKDIAARYPKFYASRQKITLPKDRKGLDDSKTIAEVFGKGAEDGELVVKDLGPQVSWQTVFLVEYAGPLVIHPLIYHFPKLWYGRDFQHSAMQQLIYTLVLLHFLKRELETLFVHRFSHGTMPLMNIFRNSAHYHILSGILLALDIYRPKYAEGSRAITETFRSNGTVLLVGTLVWAFAELSNLSTHLTLRNLRPAGTRVRGIPQGYGFEYISCPNYWFETVGWLAVTAMSGSIASLIFTVVAFATMADWAVKKHKNYKKEFANYPRQRKAIVPFIL